MSNMVEKGITPRDIVQRDSIRNAMIVAMAIGLNQCAVTRPEIDRAAGRWQLLG